jgi:hypothetical protein
MSGIRDESGSEAFVAVMQAADFRVGDDSSDPVRLDWTRVRAILAVRFGERYVVGLSEMTTKSYPLSR